MIMNNTNKFLLSTIAITGIVGVAGLTYAANTSTALNNFGMKGYWHTLIWSWSEWRGVFGLWKWWMNWKMRWEKEGCGMWKWMMIWMWFWDTNKLTDTEKEKLKTMTNDEKKVFFETKRKEMEAKRDSREAVIDKLLNWQALTDDDKKIVEEIKADRAEMKKKQEEIKAKQQEMEKKKEEIKPLLEKLKKWETLTTDEKAKLFDSNNTFKWFNGSPNE